MTGPGSPSHSRRRFALGALLILAVTAAAYYPSLSGEFIWDDDWYVSNNKLLTEPDGLRRIWFSRESPSQYFPLVYTVFLGERALWGLHATGYHLVNLVLHGANALLVWLALSRLGIAGGWLAAALFALHPVQVESVAWITELKNVLSGFFALLSFLAWLSGERAGGRRWHYLAALVCFPLALLSKTTTAVLPAVMLLVLWFTGLGFGRWRLVRIAPFAAMGTAMAALSTWWEISHQGTMGPDFAITWLERVLIAARSYWFHLDKLLRPFPLAFSYPRWDADASDPRSYLWLAMTAALIGGLWFGVRRWGRGPLAAALYYGIALAPTMGFALLYSFKFTFFADHYQYLALIGPAAFVGAAGSRWAAGGDRYGRARWIAPAAVLAALSLLTFRQCFIYKDRETIWRDTIAKNPGSWIAHSNLGSIHAEQGRWNEAIREYDLAIALKPDDGVTLYGKGLALVNLRRPEEALPYLRQALERIPKSWHAHLTLGLALDALGKAPEAEAQMRAAMFLNPTHPVPLRTLGKFLTAQGRVEEGKFFLAQASRATPRAPGGAP